MPITRSTAFAAIAALSVLQIQVVEAQPLRRHFARISESIAAFQAVRRDSLKCKNEADAVELARIEDSLAVATDALDRRAISRSRFLRMTQLDRQSLGPAARKCAGVEEGADLPNAATQQAFKKLISDLDSLADKESEEFALRVAVRYGPDSERLNPFEVLLSSMYESSQTKPGRIEPIARVTMLNYEYRSSINKLGLAEPVAEFGVNIYKFSGTWFRIPSATHLGVALASARDAGVNSYGGSLHLAGYQMSLLYRCDAGLRWSCFQRDHARILLSKNLSIFGAVWDEVQRRF